MYDGPPRPSVPNVVDYSTASEGHRTDFYAEQRPKIMTTVVVLQSAYIPWKGYFHLMREADLFIFHDDLQFTHSDWRSRNRIMTREGPRWLSIPAGRDESRRICDVEVRDTTWKQRHRRTIEQNYGRAASFAEYAWLLDFLYDNTITNLSEFNQRAIARLAKILDVTTPLDDSRRYQLRGRKTERLIDLLTQVNATTYLSGPAGRNYLDADRIGEAGIDLQYFEYPKYADYDHRFGPCVHEVTILDMLFQLGAETPRWIWGN